MMASQQADQEIDQAIERLQRKMQVVSDNLDQGRNRTRASQTKAKRKSRQSKKKGGVNRLMKYLFIFLLLGAISFIIAQIVKGYMSNQKL